MLRAREAALAAKKAEAVRRAQRTQCAALIFENRRSLPMPAATLPPSHCRRFILPYCCGAAEDAPRYCFACFRHALAIFLRWLSRCREHFAADSRFFIAYAFVLRRRRFQPLRRAYHFDVRLIFSRFQR
jgi:hypothetical protein